MMDFLSPTIVGRITTAALVAAPFVWMSQASALTGPEVNQIASQTSVHILVSEDGQTSSGRGSGFIVARDGNKYYVATNAHVVEGGRAFGLTLPDGEHVVSQEATFIGDNLDLAIVSFESDRDYAVATLTPTVEVGQDVFVSGWPPPPRGTSSVVRQFVYGRVSAELTPFGGGYEVSYSAPTDVGMSGGQVLDASGRVIAVHGMGGTADRGSVAQRLRLPPDHPTVAAVADGTDSGLNYGIPISTLINQAAASGLYLNFQVSRQPVQELNAPIADASNPAPNSPQDRIDNVFATLTIIDGVINTLDDTIDIIDRLDRLF